MERLEEMVEALSSLSRTGWMLRGVPHGLAETVAEHSFHASIIALELALRLREAGYMVDPFKAAVMALVHDLGEAVIGDIPRTAGISEAKREAEMNAVSSLPVHGQVKELIREFEESGSDEAFIARLSELLATALKAGWYRRLGFERVSEIESNMLVSIGRMLEGRVYGGVLREIIASVFGLSL